MALKINDLLRMTFNIYKKEIRFDLCGPMNATEAADYEQMLEETTYSDDQ